jgi:hypothetical protein
VLFTEGPFSLASARSFPKPHPLQRCEQRLSLVMICDPFTGIQNLFSLNCLSQYICIYMCVNLLDIGPYSSLAPNQSSLILVYRLNPSGGVRLNAIRTCSTMSVWRKNRRLSLADECRVCHQIKISPTMCADAFRVRIQFKTEESVI